MQLVQFSRITLGLRFETRHLNLEMMRRTPKRVDPSSDKCFLYIVIANSRFLQCPQKKSHGNQLIHRPLYKTKSIGSRSDPEIQAVSFQQSIKRRSISYLSEQQLANISVIDSPDRLKF